MSLHRYVNRLLNVTSAAGDTTGDAVDLKGAKFDDVPNDDQNWGCVIAGTMTGSSSPTLDLVVESSWDGGTTYVTVVAFTQVTSAGAFKERKEISGALGPYTRVRGTVSGDAQFTGTAYLTSDGKFTARSVS